MNLKTWTDHDGCELAVSTWNDGEVVVSTRGGPVNLTTDQVQELREHLNEGSQKS